MNTNDNTPNTRGKTPLEIMFLTNYRTIQEAADGIGVTYQTLKMWYSAKPANFLKYAREWKAISGLSYDEIVQVVTDTEHRLNS